MKNIIIIDMQKGFMNNNNNFLIEKINNYLKNKNFDNVFYTRYINNKDSAFEKILGYTAMQTNEEQEFSIDLKENAIIFTKLGYGLTNDMINILKEKNISEIEICGTDTDACVMAIAYNLFDNNIKPIILSDLCGSSSSNQMIHNNSLEIMARSFGKDNVKHS